MWGYGSVIDVCEVFGWKYLIYVGYENGFRGVKFEDLLRYVKVFGV